MPNLISLLSPTYNTYQAIDLPWNSLHGYCKDLATRPNAAAQPAPTASLATSAPQTTTSPSRAKLYAYRAAILPHAAMRTGDALFGTGAAKQGPAQTATTYQAAAATANDCLHDPFACGLMGLLTSSTLLRAALLGAFVGSLAGAAIGASADSKNNLEANTAALFGLAVLLSPLSTVILVTGACRAATSLAKFALVGASYAAGYAIGFVVDTLVGAFR